MMKRVAGYLLSFIMVCVVAMAFACATTLIITLGTIPMFVQKTTASTNSGTSVAVTFGTAPTAGDYLLCSLSYGAAAPSIPTAPTGFSLLNPTGAAVNAGNLSLAIYGKTVGAGASAGPYTFSYGSNSIGGALACTEFSQVDLINPVAAIQFNSVASLSPGFNSFGTLPVVPSVSGTLPVGVFALGNEQSLTPFAGTLGSEITDGTISTHTTGASTPVSLSQWRSQAVSSDTATSILLNAQATITGTPPLIDASVFLTKQGGIPVAIATSTPTPAPSSAPITPSHMHVYVDTNDYGGGCWYGDNPVGRGCPEPLGTPDSRSSYSDRAIQNSFATLSKYVDYVQTDTRETNNAALGGLKPGTYLDFVRLHLNGGCVTATTFPNSIISHDTAGNTVFEPFENPNTCGSFPGDPTTTGTGGLLTWVNQQIQGQITDPYANPSTCANGTSYPCTYPQAFTRSDDSAPHQRVAPYTVFCAGFYSTGGATGGSCPSANPPETSATWNQIPAFPPYYSPFVAGMQNILSNTITPIIYNNDYDPTISDIYGKGVATQVIGGECENCFTHGGPNDTSSNVGAWTNEVNAEIRTQMDGYIFFMYHPFEYNRNDVNFVYASLALGSIDYNLIGITESPLVSSISPISKTPMNPPYYVVPQGAIGPSITFNPASVGYNPNSPPISASYGVAALLTSTGVYAREFTSCGIAGLNVGPCASVVNPTSSTLSMPTLSRAYAHALAWSGSGVVAEAGDTGGKPSTMGTAPTSLGPNQGTFIFP